jgi:hypothetical protein
MPLQELTMATPIIHTIKLPQPVCNLLGIFDVTDLGPAWLTLKARRGH